MTDRFTVFARPSTDGVTPEFVVMDRNVRVSQPFTTQAAAQADAEQRAEDAGPVKVRQDDLCSTHQRTPAPGHKCQTCARLRLERKIMRRTVTDLIAAGYKVSLHNGECYEIINSVSVEDVMKVVMLTDEDYLYVSKEPVSTEYDEERDETKITSGFDSFVRFVYGNSGWDVINDYGVSLDPVLEPVMEYASGFEA